jgi:hypothetical protein
MALDNLERIRDDRGLTLLVFLTLQTNRFNFLGHGFTERDLDFSPGADRSPYIDVKNLDPRYYQS